MPEKKTIERARRDKAQGKSPSTQAGEFVKEEMDHIREGKHGARSTKQAIAIGLSKARRAGVPLPPPSGGKSATRRKAAQDYQKGRTGTSRRPSAKRARATRQALKREGRSAASSAALSRQARPAARPPRPPARFAGVDPAPLAAFAPGTWGPPPRIRGATLARRVVHPGLALISLRSTSRPPRPPARFAGVDPAPLAAFAPGTWGPPPRIRGATLPRRLVHAGLALISLRSTSRPPRPPARFAGVDPAPLAAFAPGPG